MTVRLDFAGTATRGRDYAVSADAVVVTPNALSGSVDIDVYRDFDAEGDETVTATVAGVEGNARVTGPRSVTFSILDGESATVNKEPPEDGEPELALLPFFFGVTEEAVVLVVSALNASNAAAMRELYFQRDGIGTAKDRASCYLSLDRFAIMCPCAKRAQSWGFGLRCLAGSWTRAKSSRPRRSMYAG